ncbi:alpha/beta hydrolase [Corallincola luteus]|uniref:Alpha/beta hydrolase n=1 Tax=Corallincola luteus TaxID=1775177 RepID=A0ABY2AL56_9GAMM|nr:alpha/beta hydrolase [Corallincola luteus]TCI01979.1 alpha/beta hydrolase [Corallincola luteus]
MKNGDVKSGKSPLKVKDLIGATQLSALAVTQVSHIAEGVHQAIWSSFGVKGGKAPHTTGGITGLVYKSIRGTTAVLSKGAVSLLNALPLQTVVEGEESPKRANLMAVLNGVIGDQLQQTHNPFATPMTLRLNGELIDLSHAEGTEALFSGLSSTGGKILLMVHGLCRNDLHWQQQHEGRLVNHGETVSQACGYQPIYLRYNSGLPVYENGRQLAEMLERLHGHWPESIADLTVLAHSMGGLVIRSACYHAEQCGMKWQRCLKHIIFLGTPHHGAPLELIGSWLHRSLLHTPFTAPFSRLAKLRSAGITDLRYGTVLEEEWHGEDRFHHRSDACRAVALPTGVNCLNVAATTASKASTLAKRLVGDGLVPLNSALGYHDLAEKAQPFEDCHHHTFYSMNHLALLSRPEVGERLVDWLAAANDLLNE